MYEIVDDGFDFMGDNNFTFSFAIKNRPPVLDYVHYKSEQDKAFYVSEGDNFTLNLSG